MNTTNNNNQQKQTPAKCGATTKSGARCRRNAVCSTFGVCNQHRAYFEVKTNRHKLTDCKIDKCLKEYACMTTNDKIIIDSLLNTNHFTNTEFSKHMDKYTTGFLKGFDKSIEKVRKTDPVYINTSDYKTIRERIVYQCMSSKMLYNRVEFNINLMDGRKLNVFVNAGVRHTMRDLKRVIMNQHFQENLTEYNIELFIGGHEEAFDPFNGVKKPLTMEHYKQLSNSDVFCLPATHLRPDVMDAGIFRAGDRVIYSSPGMGYQTAIVVEDPAPSVHKNFKDARDMVCLRDTETNRLPNSIKSTWEFTDNENDDQTNDRFYTHVNRVMRCNRWDTTPLMTDYFNGVWVDAVCLTRDTHNEDM